MGAAVAIRELTAALAEALAGLDEPARVAALNDVRRALHAVSPLRDEPVDCVLWVPAEAVEANDYNPNAVAPPEMRLLEHSVREDGFTQPIVVWREATPDGAAGADGARHEVVDGFHRHRVGRECAEVRARTRGYLPVVAINAGRDGRADRIAATIRHNRARGKHRVDAMSDIVLELARRNWGDAKIGRELGMEPDEVLRLKQISGLAALFADRAFSEAWDVESV